MQNVNTENICVVTGPDMFKYLNLGDNGQTFEERMDKLESGMELSTNYTCHTWTKEAQPRLIICTEEGDILICMASGEFQGVVKNSPGEHIHTVIAYSHGLILGCDFGRIYPYEVTTTEGQYYKLQQNPLTSQNLKDNIDKTPDAVGEPIMSLALNNTEDMLYYIDKANQLLKVPIQLDNTDIETTMSEYVHCAFHQFEVTGMDICLRKQLIVTCSKRYTVIWNYHEKKLELSKQNQVGEEAQAVAFHPSGFHILVAITDKIQMLNVLSNSIKEYSSISVKQCREIKFCNGGHLFAASLGQGNFINVYNFYTGEMA